LFTLPTASDRNSPWLKQGITETLQDLAIVKAAFIDILQQQNLYNII